MLSVEVDNIPRLICIILFILRKPNSIFVLLVIQNISKFVIKKLTFSNTFFKTFAYFSAWFHDRPYVFPWRYASKLNIRTLQGYVLRILAFLNLRWLDPVFLGGYHPTLKLSGIPTFTFIVSLTHRMDNIKINLQCNIKFLAIGVNVTWL